MNAIIPIPRGPVTVRAAVAADLPFIDGLQKLHAKQVGWMPTRQLEGKIRAGHVLIAEESDEATKARSDEGKGAGSPSALDRSVASSLAPRPVGYCIGSDQYFKRDDVGIIYQMNVLPTKQRGLIGATVVKAMFERAAYGCRLFCCWCAQDIAANRFWESLGFIPLAFRAGSRDKGRVHIFWQRRIRAGDETTPYWFPSQTSSGSIREDRLVFPIPPDTHWSDAKPIVLPSAVVDEPQRAALPDGGRARAPRKPAVRRFARGPLCGFVFQSAIIPQAPAEKPKRAPKPKVKHDPAHIAAARELRDRWLEAVNGGRMLPAGGAGKYELSRTRSAAEGSKALAGPGIELAITIPAAIPAPIAA